MAVTSNRGEGKVPRRAGANPQLEQQYYQTKYTHLKPGEIFIPNLLVIKRADLDLQRPRSMCFICVLLHSNILVLPVRGGR